MTRIRCNHREQRPDRPVDAADAQGLVFDHRILDGAGADAFLAKVKEMLETWN